MRVQIRRGVFETNSSSVHSITMCSEEDYELWKSGVKLFNDYTGEFTDNNKVEELIKISKDFRNEAKTHYDDLAATNSFYKQWSSLTASEKKQWYIQYYNESLYKDDYSDWVSFEEWNSRHDQEKFECEHTTPSGEKVIAFGYYGYD